ncbi:CPBP family intramembrane glutamic endopeptidase [Pseudonocardia nematodicida]|uniref:CPBP family intramembrane glutamic endopeptidase n=1 Tax=Pseudonocardia nematodicida TaxID=1206997 RepID=A0ABV1KCE0_9PSEU
MTIGLLVWLAVRPVVGFERGGVADAVAANVVPFGVMVLVLALWLWLGERRGLTDLALRPVRRPVLWVLIGVVLAVALLLLSQALLGLAGVGGGDGDADPGDPSGNVGIGLLLLLAVSIALQSSTEELVFRGYLMGSLRRDLGPYASVLISAVVFGLAHALNPGASAAYVAATFALGVLLGFLVLGPGGLWMSCAFHFGWNATQGLSAAGETSSPDQGSGAGAGAGLWVFVLILTCYAVVAGLLCLRRSSPDAVGTA